MLRSSTGRIVPCLPPVGRTFKPLCTANPMTEMMSSSVEGTTIAAHPFADIPRFDQREMWPWVEKITSAVGVSVGKPAMIPPDAITFRSCMAGGDGVSFVVPLRVRPVICL
jgi:hypothetical protein